MIDYYYWSWSYLALVIYLSKRSHIPFLIKTDFVFHVVIEMDQLNMMSILQNACVICVTKPFLAYLCTPNQKTGQFGFNRNHMT